MARFWWATKKDEAGRYLDGLEPGDQLLLARSCPTCPRKKYNMGYPVRVDLPGSTAELPAVAAGPRPGRAVKNKVGMFESEYGEQRFGPL